MYLGENIENSSYSLTICAERTAIFNAYLEGERNFKALAIASDAPEFCPPCGACRQVISDLCGNVDVILVAPKGSGRSVRENFVNGSGINSSFAILPAILSGAKKIIAPRFWARRNTGVWALPANFYSAFTHV